MATFTLTTGPDTFVGGPEDNRVYGTAATLNPGDSLTGGQGTDALALIGSGTFRVDQLATFTGFEKITFDNATNTSASLVLGSQPIEVDATGYVQIIVNSPSNWNASNNFNGDASRYSWMNFSNSSYPQQLVAYDLTSNLFSHVSGVHSNGDNITLLINSSDTAGIQSFDSFSASDNLVTAASTLDLSHTTVSGFRVSSTNGIGTTFTVGDLGTALQIAGGPGHDTLIAQGLTLTASERADIFVTGSIETITDQSGTYSASPPSPGIVSLTTGNDTFVAPASGSTVYATAATLNPGDSLTGGQGTDALALIGSGTFRVDQLATFTGFEKITFDNATNTSASLVLGSQPIEVDATGYVQIIVNSPSNWNASNNFNGDASRYSWMNFSNSSYPQQLVAYDLTSNLFSHVSGVHSNGDNITLLINSSDTAGIQSFDSFSASDNLVTAASTLDLSHTTVSGFRVSSTNGIGTTFTVGDLGTALQIAGGPGHDTLIAQGLTLTASERADIFVTGSIETITDQSGTYTASPPSAPPTLSVRSNQNAMRGQVVNLSMLATVSDPGSVGYAKLELWDSNGTAIGGQFVVNGLPQTGAHEIDVSPTNVASTVFDVGTLGGTDTLWAQLVQNDGALTGWQQFTVTAPVGRQPSVTVTSLNATRSQVLPLSSLVTILDPDGVGYTQLELWDSTGTAAGGQFEVSGTAQTGGHEIDVAPANVANSVFDVGIAGGTDTLWARLLESNGQLTPWHQFTVTAPTAQSPTLTVNNDATATRGQQIALSSLITIPDPDGVGYQKLELWDSNGTAAGGQFVVNGISQTGGHEIDVSPADFANTVFDVGTLGGTDTLWAQLLENNGTLASWQQFTVTAPLAQQPTFTVSNDPTATRGQQIALSSLVTISDPDKLGYQSLELWDTNGTLTGGQFMVNGMAQPGQQTIDVAPSDVGKTVFDVGTLGGSNVLYAQLIRSDGEMSGWQSFTVTAPLAQQPTLSVSSSSGATRGQVINLSTLVSISDPDGVGYQKLELWDLNGTITGGQFVVNGTAQTGGHEIDVSGKVNGYALIREADNVAVQQWTSIPNRVNFVGSDGANIQVFAAGPGYEYDGYKIEPSTWSDAANAVFDIGTLGGTDTLWARLLQDDGTLTSWQQFRVTVPAVRLPSLNLTSITATRGEQIGLANLVTIVDPDSVGYQKLELWDSNGTVAGGHFVVSSITQTGGHEIDVSPTVNGFALIREADNIAVQQWTSVPNRVDFVGSDGASIQVFAAGPGYEYDGYKIVTATWGDFPNTVFDVGTLGGTDMLWAQLLQNNGQLTGWQQFNVTAPAAQLPTMSVHDVSGATASQSISLLMLVTISDPDNVGYQKLELWDSNGTTKGGQFIVNGTPQSGGHEIDVAPTDVSNTVFDVGSTGAPDTLWARLLQDNGALTAWQQFTVKDPVTVVAGTTVEISSAYAGAVIFAADTGTLQLDNSASFTGTVAGMAGTDTIDFADIDPRKVLPPSYNGDASGGVLNVTDGAHSANIALIGNYMASVFVPSSDGHGGTSVVDPPAVSGVQPLVTPPHA